MSELKQKKSIKKIISDIAFGIVMGFIGLIILFSILQKTIGFSIGGYHVLWVRTNSMEDTIPASSYILVKEVNPSDVHEGMIITFKSEDPVLNGELNTHRVIEAASDGSFFITKGDNNFSQDAYKVHAENVLYEYKDNLPFLSLFGKLFVIPAGYVITIVGIVGLIGIWFTIDIVDRKKEEKQKLIDSMVEEEVKRLEDENSKK